MKNKKKILHVVGGMNRAGSETMIMNIYRNIDRNKIQFDFISYYAGEADYDKEIINLGGKIIKLQSPNKIGIVNAIRELKYAIKENGPYDVVHAHTLFNCGIAMIASRLAGVKIRISHSHTTMDSNNSTIIRKIYFNIMRLVIKVFSTNYLACSKSAAVYLFGENIVNSKTYQWFPNSIDYEKFIECNDEELLEHRDDEIIICHIGRFVKEKNHEFILEIAKQLKVKDIKYKILLVGNGPTQNYIKNNSKNLNIEFLGIRDDIPKILKNSDVFIFPSTFEGLGLVLLEAQAAGLPCVVSEAIQSEANLGLGLVKQLNLSDGAEKWSQEILNIKASKEKDTNNIKKAFEENEYSTEKCISRLMKLYNISYGEVSKCGY